MERDVFRDRVLAVFRLAQEELVATGSMKFELDESGVNVEVVEPELAIKDPAKRAIYLTQRILPLLGEALNIRTETVYGLADLRRKISLEAEDAGRIG